MTFRKITIFLAAIIAVMLALSVQASTIQGVVTHVTDGDTLWVKPAGGGDALDVRIQGIDAPESCQDYGQLSQLALAQHVLHKTVTITTKARDKYGRVIAHVSLGNHDVGAWMVRSGHAWSNHFRNSGGTYAREEVAAKRAGLGLWGFAHAVEPKEFRKLMQGTKCHKPRK